MKKIYGFKSSDLKGLTEYLNKNKPQNLSQAFIDYGNMIGKAKGTVRNMYYALAKQTKTDKNLCKKYFDGQPLKVEKAQAFSPDTQRELIKNILVQTNKGYSVRKAISFLADGDMKKALRFQNKYRNTVKNNPEMIGEIADSCGLKNPLERERGAELQTQAFFNDDQARKVKTAIDGLVDRLAQKLQRENAKLKEQVLLLEKENMFLKSGKTFAELENNPLAKIFNELNKKVIS